MHFTPLSGNILFVCGVIAQLVERYNGIVEVRGSTPLGSTTWFRRGKDLAQQVKIDQEAVRSLAELLRETDLTEIEYQVDSLRIKVMRNVTQAVVPVAAAPTVVASAAESVSEPAKEAEKSPEDDFLNSPGLIEAQMVGTVYLAPGPDAAPFVSVGDTVSEGQTLFIIEAMKVMNMVKSPRAGVVKHVFVQSGQPVEYGDPIIVVD